MTKAGKREQILIAAAEALSRNSYYSIRIEDIASKAGVGKGTVYEYFKSKRELFEDTVTYVLEAYLSMAKESLQGIDDPVAKLKRLALLQVSALKRERSSAALFIKGPNHIHGGMLKRLMDYRKRILSFVEGIIEEGTEKGVFRKVEPYIVAALFVGALQEAGEITCKGIDTDERFPDLVTDYLIKGIVKDT